MKEELEKLRTEAFARIEQCGDLSQLRQLEVDYLGRKGAITRVLRQMGSVPPEERATLGKLANELKAEIQKAIDARYESFEKTERERRLRIESADVTLPGIRPEIGHLHPITIVFDEVRRIFEGLGFQVATGPE
ncbi:phenylalanine--tRNA ligase subunit alpha, partial [Candidatus Poribacteria bacterium]|nr:phenylalanine--tRNA ligase subunit alpha [Candidatus Poribacteria bacterium]